MIWQVCDMTHWYLSHDAFMCVQCDTSLHVTWLVGIDDDLELNVDVLDDLISVWHDPLIFVTRRIHVRGVGHDSTMRAIWHIHIRDMTRWNRREARIKCGCHRWFDRCVTWPIGICHMTHSCVWRDSAMTHWYLSHDAFMCVAWLIHVCEVTHSCVWRDSFMCVKWLIHVCGVTRRCARSEIFLDMTWVVGIDEDLELSVDVIDNSIGVWYDSFVCVTWRIYIFGATRSHGRRDVLILWHDAFTRVIWRITSQCEWVMSHIWMSHVTHMNESWHIYEWVMSQIWISHVTHMNESCQTHACVMSNT